MKNKPKLNILLVFVLILLIIGIFYFFYNQKENNILNKKEVTPDSSSNSLSNWGGSDKFVFIEDYKVEQPVYNGGDFPSGTKTTVFKKGDIIEGKYGVVGCQGIGCVPPEVVKVVIDGINLAIDKTILVPYKK